MADLPSTNESTSATPPWTWMRSVLLYGLGLGAAYLLTVAVLANLGSHLPPAIRARLNVPLNIARRGDSTLLRFREIEEQKDLDVLFLGSSHCYRTFDPRFFSRHGLRTFNMGSTAQAPLNTYHLLKKHLPRLSPRVVVQEVYFGVLESSGYESLLDLLENTPLDRTLVDIAVGTGDFRALNGVLVRAFDLTRPPLQEVAPAMYSGDLYVSGGFVERLRPKSDWDPPTARPIEPRDEQLDYLVACAALARTRGARVVWVIQPMPTETLARYPNLEAVRTLQRRTAEAAGVPLWDFNVKMDLGDRGYYFDDDHLNQQGVERLNAKLLVELEQGGYLDP